VGRGGRLLGGKLVGGGAVFTGGGIGGRDGAPLEEPEDTYTGVGRGVYTVRLTADEGALRRSSVK